MEQSVEENAGPRVKKRRKRCCGKSAYSNKNAIRSREYRSQETPEKRTARLSHMKLLAKLRRCSETEEEREQRLRALRWYQKSRNKKRQLKQKIEPNASENQIRNNGTTLSTCKPSPGDKSKFDENSKFHELSSRIILKTTNSRERTSDNDSLKNCKTNKRVTFNLSNLGESMKTPSGHTNSVRKQIKPDSIAEFNGDLLIGFNQISENEAKSKLKSYQKMLKKWLNGKKLFKNSIKTNFKTLNCDLHITPFLSSNDSRDVNKLNEAMDSSGYCKDKIIPFNGVQNISSFLNIEQTPIVSVKNCEVEEKKKSDFTKSKAHIRKNVKNKRFKEHNFQNVYFEEKKHLSKCHKFDDQASCRTVDISTNELNLRQLTVQIKCESYHLDVSNKDDSVSNKNETVSLLPTYEDPKCLRTFDSIDQVVTHEGKPDSNEVFECGKPRISLKPFSELI